MNKDYLTRVAAGNYSGGVDSIFSVSGDTMLPMMRRICFGQFTKYFHKAQKCDITVRLFPEIKPDTPFYGVTPFELEEIIEYLNDLKKIFPFEFNIKESTCKSQNAGQVEEYIPFDKGELKCYEITYSIDGPHIEHMFVLTMQRFLYARTDCYYLALALKIRHDFEEFKKMNLFNILNCVISTISPNSRGGDMFHFDAHNFCHLWSSSHLREHLLKMEETAQDEKKYGVNGVADLYSCMVYCRDTRLQRASLDLSEAGRFFGLQPNTSNAKNEYFDRMISSIVSNLRILREYNGYSELGKKKFEDIERLEQSMNCDRMNFYTEDWDKHDAVYKAPETKFDESLLENP